MKKEESARGLFSVLLFRGVIFFAFFSPEYLHISEKGCTFAPANEKSFGRIAQLVQSICLTSRGSGVRIPLRPQKKIKELAIKCNSFFRVGMSLGCLCGEGLWACVRWNGWGGDKTNRPLLCNGLLFGVIHAGFKPATPTSVVWYSIQLS